MLKKNAKKIAVLSLVVALVCSVYINISRADPTVTSDPGSDGDPIVSKSYVDSSLQATNAQLEAEIKILKDQISAGGSQGFQAISIKAGQTILTGGGTEVILRSGKATAIMGANGGLSDTTAAKDLLNGVVVSTNHLLISSRDDGRGFRAVNDCWLLVRGAYNIKDSASVNTGSTGSSQPTTLGTGTVNISTLNIRENPNTTSAILAKAVKGETLEVLSLNDNWYKVKTSSGIYGYALSTYVTLNN